MILDNDTARETLTRMLNELRDMYPLEGGSTVDSRLAYTIGGVMGTIIMGLAAERNDTKIRTDDISVMLVRALLYAIDQAFYNEAIIESAITAQLLRSTANTVKRALGDEIDACVS